MKNPLRARLPNFAEIRKNLPYTLRPRNLIAVVLLSPIIVLIIGDPQTFTLNWGWEGQVGRGSFLFLVFIVLWEWLDSRKRLPGKSTKLRLILSILVFSTLIAYYAARVLSPQLRVDLYNFGYSIGAGKGTDSFPLAVDYIAYVVLAFFETLILLGPRGFKAITTPVVYSLGTTVLVLLDAFFPYDSLAFMQNWVGIIWTLVVAVLGLTGVRVVSTPKMLSPAPAVDLVRNSLLVNGSKGFVAITIYWPSSGVVSMLIFSTVIAVIVIKMDIPLKRKIIYAAVGAFGTFMVNVIRVSMIVAYVMFVSLDVEAFHAVIGEILFLIWILIYLILIIRYENRYLPPAVYSKRPRSMALK
jgi:thaumarchaeosortase